MPTQISYQANIGLIVLAIDNSFPIIATLRDKVFGNYAAMHAAMPFGVVNRISEYARAAVFDRRFAFMANVAEVAKLAIRERFALRNLWRLTLAKDYAFRLPEQIICLPEVERDNFKI